MARCTHRTQPARGDPGMGIRRARTEAVQVPPPGSRKRNTQEILSRPADGEGPSEASKTISYGSRAQGFYARSSVRGNCASDLTRMVPYWQRPLREGEQLLRHDNNQEVARH